MAENTRFLMGRALLGTQPFFSLEETGPGIGQRRSVERKMSTRLDFQLRSFSKSYPLNCRNNPNTTLVDAPFLASPCFRQCSRDGQRLQNRLSCSYSVKESRRSTL